MELEKGKTYQSSMEEMPSNFYFLGTLGAIALSAMFFLMGRKSLAFFIGLWPPTILAMGLFYKILRPSHEPVGEQLSRAAEQVTKTTR
ncbi:MAG: hypothetical protein HYY30_13105 [Chloroflexi bacterium]|nr:hypothetical protein [Chloroflexota bacterium]